MIQYCGSVYREAGAADLARMVLGYLWTWIYKAGITKQQLLDWFSTTLNCSVPQRSAGVIPTALRDTIMKLMAQHSFNCGDFMMALEEEVEKPVPGFRWKADKFGRHVLVEVRSDVGERAMVQGKRFANDIFIGAWWTTQIPGGSANRKLQNHLRRQGGSVFWNEKLPAGGRQYGAFLIVPRAESDVAADALCVFADQVDLEGSGEHRLSAVSMAGIAEHREVRSSDQIWTGCIRSIKFTWKHSLPDLLNGRIEQFQKSKPYQNLVRMIREN